jgi:hypothetical protein
VVQAAGRRVGFEIDGRDFHDGERDAWRDAAILASGKADVMIHIPAADIYRYPYDALFLISRVEAALFSERGRSMLERLAHRGARRAIVSPDNEHLGAVIWRQEDEVEPEDLDEPLEEDLDDGLSARERADRREEKRVWDRILEDDMRYGQQSPYCLSISRRWAGGSLQPWIACVRRFGPASLDEVRAVSAQPPA